LIDSDGRSSAYCDIRQSGIIVMNRHRRLGVPWVLSLIAIVLVSRLLAEDDPGEEVAAEVRDLALRNYRANYTTVGGVKCKITQTITMDMNLLSCPDSPSVNVEERECRPLQPENANRRKRRDNDRVGYDPLILEDEDSDFEEEEDESSVPIVKYIGPLGLSKRMMPTASGIISGTSEHRVLFCDSRVRNECYVGDNVEGRHIRNGVECSYENTTACGVFGTPLVSRGTIDDPSMRSGPIIDPRDFGASSGIGRLEEMLATWEVVSANSCIVKCGRSGLIAIKLREPVAAREHRDFVNECILYLDQKTRLLPVVVEHFQQGTLLQVVEIAYAKCDWLPETCYLATEAVYAMPADPEQSGYSNVAEIKAHSRQRFVVSEAVAFKPADNDKMFRLRSTKTIWSNGFESTLIAAPPEPPATVDRIVEASKTLPMFLGSLLFIAAGGVGVVLRQQLSAR
jgi:hypothetical protein